MLQVHYQILYHQKDQKMRSGMAFTMAEQTQAGKKGDEGVLSRMKTLVYHRVYYEKNKGMDVNNVSKSAFCMFK